MSSAFVVGALLFAGSNSWAQSVNYTITNANTFTAASTPLGGVASCAIATGAHEYSSQQFTVSSNASYVVETTTATLGAGDTFIALYNVAFDPNNPTTGLVACDDDSSALGGGLSKITANLVTGTTYTLVVTAYLTVQTGTATAAFTPDVILGAATGGAGGGGSPPVSALIDLDFSEKPTIFATEIEVK